MVGLDENKITKEQHNFDNIKVEFKVRTCLGVYLIQWGEFCFCLEIVQEMKAG